MKKNILALFFGVIFGLGLSLSKMTDPQVVLDFFDVFGKFNPLLLWVFISALLTTILGYLLIFKLKKPVFDEKFYLHEKYTIDKPLVIGSILFGMGWGISGYCPAPVIGMAFINSIEFLIFVIPMLLAIGIVHYHYGSDVNK